MRRWLALVACVVMALGLGAPALGADPEPVGPTGSTFDGEQVVCGSENAEIVQPPVIVCCGDEFGIEVCSDALGTRVFASSNRRPTIGPLHGISWVHADVYNTHVLHIPLTP